MTQREKQLFIYISALEQGDFDTVSQILEHAQSDPELEHMILDANDELINEMPVLSTTSPNNGQATEETDMNISLPLQQQNYRKAQTLPLTLLVATIVTALFAAFIFFQDQNSRPTLSLATTPEQSLQETSENVTIFEQYLSAWETYDATLLEGIITEDYTLHLFPGLTIIDIVGMEEMARVLTDFESASIFNDAQNFTIDAIREDTERNQLWVSVSIEMNSLIIADNEGLHPTVEYIVSFTDEQIAEVWMFFDSADMLWQAGIWNTLSLLSIQQQNIATVQNLIQEVWNDANYENLANYYTDTFTLTSPLNGAILEWTLADAEESMVDMHYAFEDLELTIDTLSVSNNTVTVEFTANAIHTGLVYIGDGRMNPTGEPISWTGIFVYEFNEDGLIIEERNYWTFNEYTRAFFGVED